MRTIELFDDNEEAIAWAIVNKLLVYNDGAQYVATSRNGKQVWLLRKDRGYLLWAKMSEVTV